MSVFNSFLAKELDEFTAYRLSLGFSAKTFCSNLKIFDRHLAKRGKKPILLQPSFFLEMRSNLHHEARTVNRVLSATRVFFDYLVRCDIYQIELIAALILVVVGV